MNLNLLISNSRASYYTGGTEVVSLHQATNLARLGHRVTYLVRETPEYSGYFADFQRTIAEEELPIRIGEVAVRAPFGNGHSWATWNHEAAAFGIAAQDAYRHAIDDGAELAVTHMSADALYVPDDIPQALHLHGSPRGTDPLIDMSMTRPDYGVAHSTSIHEWWSSRYPALPMDTFRNGVPVETFDHPPEADRPIDILYVGRFLEHKGVTDILEAATPDQKVVVAGSGIYRDEIARIIKARGLDATIMDSPDNETLVELYKKAKIFACPSRGKEGVLTTMLEASAAGCTIVTASGSGMTDLAKDTINSRLAQPGDVAALRQVFGELLSDDEQRLGLAHTMQNTIHSSWSWEAKAKELEGIYEKARNTR